MFLTADTCHRRDGLCSNLCGLRISPVQEESLFLMLPLFGFILVWIIRGRGAARIRGVVANTVLKGMNSGSQGLDRRVRIRYDGLKIGDQGGDVLLKGIEENAGPLRQALGNPPWALPVGFRLRGE